MATSSADAVEPAGRAQPLEQLVDRRALALGGRLERLADLLVGGLDVLGLDDRGQHGLAPQRGGGLGLGLVRERLLVPAGDPQVGLLGDALAGEHAPACPRAAHARARERACRDVDLGLADRRLDHGLLELALDRALVGLAQALGDVLAQLGQRVEPGRLGRRTRRRPRAAASP